MNCPHNLYIHVPFCISKCKYCAFYSVPGFNPNWEKYTKSVCEEISFWANKLGRIKIPTVFFGGGTPSLMPIKAFETIMHAITDNFDLDENCEITLESNPGTLDNDKLQDFIDNGVNRLSIGVQSFKDSELEFLGRIHNAKQSLNLIESAQNKGIRVSGDFIYGLPNQTVQDVQEICQNINNIGLTHASLYELTIEKNTPFGNMHLNMPNNETMADMYMAINDTLKLNRYEVSNYANPNQECRHNQNIWFGDAYIGIGRAGAGRIFIDGVWYEQMGNYEKFESISIETRAIEKIITGLRTTRGVELSGDVLNQLNMDWINSHKDLVALSDKYLYTTPRGFLILDNIISEVIK